MKNSNQINARLNELSLISKIMKLTDQTEICKTFHLWEILREYIDTDSNPHILMFSLTILSSLCFDDECCYQVRIHCAYSVSKLLMTHTTKALQKTKGQYVL